MMAQWLKPRGRAVARLVCLWLGLCPASAVLGAPTPAQPQTATRPTDSENFHLASPDGRSYSLESFAPDKVLVIYFGYAACQRTCPVTLNAIAEAIDRLGPGQNNVQAIFIDIDPDRAAGASLGPYVQAFGERVIGLTGSRAEIENAERSFNVRVERLQFSAAPGDYAMKHTSPIFVMRPTDPHPLKLSADSSIEAIETACREALARAE
jgi:cytochrome oxidase Cu insertion factor (SCO1/SenC/PrrC family)